MFCLRRKGFPVKSRNQHPLQDTRDILETEGFRSSLKERPSQMTNGPGNLLNVLKPQIMCVKDSLLFPLQENQVYFNAFSAAWARPCLRARTRIRAGREYVHLSDKPTHWSAKCGGAKSSDVTATEANAIEVNQSVFRLAIQPRMWSHTLSHESYCQYMILNH